MNKYIAESDDLRPKIEIKKAAKIGTWNGALVRVCEGEGCKKSESKEVTLKFCKIVCEYNLDFSVPSLFTIALVSGWLLQPLPELSLDIT